MILIFAIGANDTIFNPKDDERNPATSPEEFRANCKKLIALGRYYDAKTTFFIGLTPVNEDKTIPVAWDEKVAYSNFWLNEYRKITEEVIQEGGVSYIPMWDIFAEGDWKSMLPDGLHPNSDGHKLMFEKIKEDLRKLLLL